MNSSQHKEKINSFNKPLKLLNSRQLIDKMNKFGYSTGDKLIGSQNYGLNSNNIGNNYEDIYSIFNFIFKIFSSI